MGWFSRRRRAATDGMWRPVTPDPALLTGDDAVTGDDGQATGNAYLAVFGCEEAPDALIGVCTYVADSGDGRYCLGLRYDYTAGGEVNWAHTGYVGDPLDEIYEDPGEAEAEAEAWATILAEGNAASIANLAAVFGWDGEPFEVAS